MRPKQLLTGRKPPTANNAPVAAATCCLVKPSFGVSAVHADSMERVTGVTVGSPTDTHCVQSPLNQNSAAVTAIRGACRPAPGRNQIECFPRPGGLWAKRITPPPSVVSARACCAPPLEPQRCIELFLNSYSPTETWCPCSPLTAYAFQ